MKDFKLPDLGEGVHEGQIIRVMIKPGDSIREDQPLMEVETDKAAVVIPSPFAGVVEKVHVRDGQTVHVGDVMVSFGDAKSTPKAGPVTSVARASSIQGRSEASERQTSSHGSPLTGSASSAAIASPMWRRRKPASPAVRKLARSMGIDIETIDGSGPGGRVQRADLEIATRHSHALEAGSQGLGGAMPRPAARTSFSRPTQPPTHFLLGSGGATPPNPRVVAARVAYPAVPESVIVEPPGIGEDASDAHGPTKRVALTQARKTIANVMAQSWSTIPHATDFDDADVTELDKIRRGYSSGGSPDDRERKLTMLAFVVRAVVRSLQRFPEFNASIDVEKNEVVYKRYFNIAIGVHTERGLVPIVLRDADKKSIPQISDELAIIGEKARTAAFAVNDTRGGTYTVSNAGAMGGSRYSTPIITPPQVAVLAIGKTRWMPWVTEQDGQRGIAPRLIMPLSHSIDHRLLDGGQEVLFMQHVIGDLQNPARLLL